MSEPTRSLFWSGLSMSALLYVPKTRLVWMDCPTSERVTTLAAELEWHHEAHYMVWDVAGTGEAGYDPEAFGGRVVQLRYAGHLCPPLTMLMEACASIHAWLRADTKNICAVHCRSGRGRSAVVLSCVAAFLSVHNEASGPASPIDWLSHLAHLRHLDERKLTLPTHRRYLQYFAECAQRRSSTLQTSLLPSIRPTRLLTACHLPHTRAGCCTVAYLTVPSTAVSSSAA